MGAGVNVTSQAASSFYIAPLRAQSVTTDRLLMYNITTGELRYSTANSGSAAKTFCIQHPYKEDHYLVHECIESDNTNIMYRGKDVITSNQSRSIILPEYATVIGFNWTVSVTVIGRPTLISSSDVNKFGQFEVYGNNGTVFHWVVYGKRHNIKPEIKKSDVDVDYFGPYANIKYKN